MTCFSCSSEIQQQFPSELAVHVPELKNLNMTRVLVVSDDLMRAKELVARHSKERSWEPCGAAGSSEQAIEMLFDLRPDLIVIDASISTVECARTAHEMRRAAPAVKICLFGPLLHGSSLTAD
jgi:CheY-like chemotaxis protein